MRDKIIFHFVKVKWWHLQKSEDLYFSENFQQEGFIHASTREQLQATSNRYYRNEAVVYLLHIDTDKLSSILKYEMSPSIQQEFPHIFGGINKEAIMKVEKLYKSKEDSWMLD